MFFDFPEIVIIFGVALVVLGPKKLPGTAAQIGRWVGRARAMARQFREQLEQEVSSVENALDTQAPHEPSIRGTASPPTGIPPAPTPSSETPPSASTSASAERAHAPSPPYPPYLATPAPSQAAEEPPPQQESFPFTEPYSGSPRTSASQGTYGLHEAYGSHEAYGAPFGVGMEDFEAGLAATGVPPKAVATPPSPESASPERPHTHAGSEAPSASGERAAEDRERH